MLKSSQWEQSVSASQFRKLARLARRPQPDIPETLLRRAYVNGLSPKRQKGDRIQSLSPRAGLSVTATEVESPRLW